MNVRTAITGHLGINHFLAGLRPMPKTFESKHSSETPLCPLSQPRNRLSASIADGQIGSTTCSQAQSQLMLRIPVGLRLLIWEHAIGRENANDILHLEPVDGTLRHCRCHESDLSKVPLRHVCWSSVWRKEDRDQDIYSIWEPRESRKIRSLN